MKTKKDMADTKEAPVTGGGEGAHSRDKTFV